MLTTQPENKNTKKKIMYDLNNVLKFRCEFRKEERKLNNNYSTRGGVNTCIA